jgi:hypothetical protein
LFAVIYSAATEVTPQQGTIDGSVLTAHTLHDDSNENT